MRAVCLMLLAMLAGGCAIGRPDHFYALDSGNSQPPIARSRFGMQVNLRVSLPMMVDRSEMVLSHPGGVSILEHERWAAPLAEQFTRVLGQDIEARRPDVLVVSRSIAQTDEPTSTVAVEVVELTLQKSTGTRMEARWRVQSGSESEQGREILVSPAPDASFEGLVLSLDACIASLADRLVARLH